eukprot:10038181-Ditylum_brightwellii.AAC.1
MMITLAESTKNAQQHVNNLQVFTKVQNKRQKYGINYNKLDTNMKEMDALHENRDTLDPDPGSQGTEKCPLGHL